MFRTLEISEHGKALTRSLVQYFATVDAAFPKKETMQLMRYLMGDEVANLLDLPPKTAPNSTVRFFKLINNLQLLKQVNSRFAYQHQQAEFKKMRSNSSAKKLSRYTLPISLTS